ncbi:MAG: hypothetical protein JW941_10010, partial [Candidatus Coatesbacteria bacterium]|nr:hypothetical protein [Candidatus Coatesbacteria bacterium]
GSTIQYAPSYGYPPDSQVKVDVHATDLEGNEMPEYEFSFTTAENSPPTLDAGGVTPTSGDDEDLFIYMVEYVDDDYDEPSRAMVYIVDETEAVVDRLSMETSATYGSNGTYQAMTSLDEGYYYYYFDFEDEYGASARLPETGYYSGPDVDRHNTAPMLSSPMLSPPTGDSDTTFWFSVYYWDIDKDVASTAKIVVASSTKEYSSDMVLTEGSADDGTFTYCGTLPAGTYNHYFQFTDKRGASVKMPSAGYYIGPVVTGESSRSYLSYGGVSPSLGSTGTEFEFRVHFYDGDGEAPSVSTLYYRSDMTHSVRMTLGNGMLYNGDYTYKTKLSVQPEWYYFSFLTANEKVIRLPQEGYFYGPNLAGSLNSSLLDTGGVDPVLGGADDEFTFSVHYYDVSGGAPLSAEVQIQASGWSATEDMELVTGDSPSNGEYIRDMELEANAYEYYFIFADSQGTEVRLPETGSFEGPFVDVSNQAPSLTDGTFSPQCGVVDDSFTFSVHYFDADGNEPGIKQLILHSPNDIIPIQLALESGTAANGTYSVETSIPAGVSQHRFRFVDVRGGAVSYPEDALADGPTVGDFSLALSVDSEAYTASDALKLLLDLANNTPIDFSVTFAAAIQFPTGELIYFPDWGMSPDGLDVVLPADFEIEGYPLLALSVPDVAPHGVYMAYAGIFGVGDFGCPISRLAETSWRIE